VTLCPTHISHRLSLSLGSDRIVIACLNHGRASFSFIKLTAYTYWMPHKLWSSNIPEQGRKHTHILQHTPYIPTVHVSICVCLLWHTWYISKHINHINTNWRNILLGIPIEILAQCHNCKSKHLNNLICNITLYHSILLLLIWIPNS